MTLYIFTHVPLIPQSSGSHVPRWLCRGLPLHTGWTQNDRRSDKEVLQEITRTEWGQVYASGMTFFICSMKYGIKWHSSKPCRLSVVDLGESSARVTQCVSRWASATVGACPYNLWNSPWPRFSLPVLKICTFLWRACPNTPYSSHQLITESLISWSKCVGVEQTQNCAELLVSRPGIENGKYFHGLG